MDCAFLEECRQGYETSAAQVDRLYSELSHKQLTRKPAENRWSVVQCIDHLVKVREAHVERLRDVERCLEYTQRRFHGEIPLSTTR